MKAVYILFLLCSLLQQTVSVMNFPFHGINGGSSERSSNGNSHKLLKKVAVIGSGNWGTAVAKRIALNIEASRKDAGSKQQFQDEVTMWVYEERVDDRNLSEIINTDHTNPKYLPNITLPMTVVAEPSLLATCKDADVLVFVVPHQFLPGVLQTMRGHVKSSAVGVSLIKGLNVRESGPELLSEMIKKELGLSEIAVIMGANVASEVAQNHFVEATCASTNLAFAEEIKGLLHCKDFNIEVCSDVATVEMCGALKNVIAMAAGFCDGLDQGPSTKAAIIRQGLAEIAAFCKVFAGDSFQTATLLKSCGVADLVATCFGGRNRLCSAEFVRRLMAARDAQGEAALTKLWTDVERDLLHGQKLQGLGTCDEVHSCLVAKRLAGVGGFPLLEKIHAIARLGADPHTLFDFGNA